MFFFSQVLASFKIMDYSLLVGIHNLDLAAREKQVSLPRSKKLCTTELGIIDHFHKLIGV